MLARYPALTYLTAGTLLLGLPPAGTWLAGDDLRQYLEFPPLTRYVEPAGVSGCLPFGLECLVLGDLVLTPLLPSRERP
jgi:hypothetical protein